MYYQESKFLEDVRMIIQSKIPFFLNFIFIVISILQKKNQYLLLYLIENDDKPVNWLQFVFW